MEPENTPLEKEETSSKPSFLGSMLISMATKHWKSVGLAGFSQNQGARRFFGAILVYHQLWMENDHEVQLALAEGRPPTTTKKNKPVGGENFDRERCHVVFFLKR